MLAADTNVWARAFLNEDASQARRARSALAEARSATGVFVPLLVLAELSWKDVAIPVGEQLSLLQ